MQILAIARNKSSEFVESEIRRLESVKKFVKHHGTDMDNETTKDYMKSLEEPIELIEETWKGCGFFGKTCASQGFCYKLSN